MKRPTGGLVFSACLTKRFRAFLLMAFAIASLFSAGCSTTAMKGTPYFSGEYTQKRGDPEDRINIWPFFYYDEPALSVLWPIGEYTEDRLVIRPLLSIEDMNQEERIYNVLWPLARFNQQTDDSRIFPFFWGDDYAVAFPAYWHLDDPFGGDKRGVDALWPLWCYFRDKEQFSLHLAWPFLNFKSYRNHRGGRIWPLYGSYERPRSEKGYTYALWPLGWHTWARNRESWSLLPLFHSSRQGDKHTFGTLLGGWHHDESEASTDWLALPALSWGSNSPRRSESNFLLGLAGHLRNGNERHSRLLPLYYHSRSEGKSLFISPLYSQGKDVEQDTTWSCLLPLYYRGESETDSLFISPLYARGVNKAEQSNWSYLLPLYLRNKKPQSSFFVSLLYARGKDNHQESKWSYLLPLYYRGESETDSLFISPLYARGVNKAEQSNWSYLLPLYLRNKKPQSSFFVSLLYARGEDNHQESKWSYLLPLYLHSSNPNRTLLVSPLYSKRVDKRHESDWSYLLPLYFRTQSPGGSLFLSPLYFRGKNIATQKAWSSLLPLYYRDRDPEGSTFITALGGWWRDSEQANWSIFPLLTGLRRGSDDGDFWLLGPLGHYGWEGDSRTQWLLPLYYSSRDADRRALITPLGGRWGNGDRKSWAVFPLLTGMQRDDDEGSFWLLGPLGHYAWSGDQRTHWLLPLYYGSRDGDRRALITPLGGRWGNGDRKTWAVFPLLTGMQRDDDEGSFWLLGPLGHYAWSGDQRTHWLLPLYYSKRDGQKRALITPLAGRWANQRDDFWAVFPLLTGMRRSERDGSFWFLGPIGHASWDAQGASHWLLPFYGYDHREKMFLSLPYAGWDSKLGRAHVLPPLLSGWSHGDGGTDVVGLLGLFRARWGRDLANSGYLFPLYGYGPDTFITPIFGHYEEAGTRRDYWLTPIAGMRTGQTTGSWLFPIYDHKRTGDTTRGAFLLLGRYRNTPSASSAEFPILFHREHWKSTGAEVDDTRWRGRTGTEFKLLLLGKFADYEVSRALPRKQWRDPSQGKADFTRMRVQQNRFWPLWNFESRQNMASDWERAKGSVLFWLYDSKREVGHTSSEKNSANDHDYTHRRVLYLLMDYERLNGVTSVDVFPFITYDRNPNKDLRKVSFLWRFFRYQREKESKKVDLLFIPVWRSGGDTQE